MASATESRSEVLVVGAGLAGLACALDLVRAGRSVRLLEGSDAVGGRMRTDLVEGFLLDRGFQVFNTSYPQVKRRLDLAALALRRFTPGVLLDTGPTRVRLSDPTRPPYRVADLLPGRFASVRDTAALAALGARDLLAPPALLRRGADPTTRTALARAGVSDELVERFFRPFLAGVFLEDGLETSGRFFHLVWRSMLRGSLCLPSDGIRAVPEQLAAFLPPGVLRLRAEAAELDGTTVRLRDGSTLSADAVVVATGAATAAALLPGLEIPAGRVVTTYYHAAPASPLREPTLLVDGAGPLLHTCVPTEVAPAYGSDGRALVSSSRLGRDAPGRELEVRARLAELYRTDTDGWQHLRTYVVEDALPAMPAPHPLIRRTRLGGGRYVCGDHRATGSVQGALASGTRAAREVLADLAAPRRPSA
ncbi:FAD-dependent oxidoreductase [Streptacidiphilus sp. PB12-B1b]|uniref:NAD(P)/FAD-dependent oxidoreductase n=1 Tax=Streptacidiphilus sp. PB12-B1b TaxID=2705012 RepID=UPI0015FE2BDB|nr:NAD(P)/FAD-dependent oxidoreductase [Streptacidiphilus sp. PB12-B1b]QMU77143.1 FAD-dependent oxidoreductase [Streptacidiphilus sp. PB12-B1b]